MEFLKMEGLGNDFVVFEGPEPRAEDIRDWCNRRTGIGADGVLRVTQPGDPQAVLRMEYWNADGTPAEMCGNGLRCITRYGLEQGWTERETFRVETPVGLRQVERKDPERYRVELGPYRVDGEIQLEGYEFTRAQVSNPHVVTFVSNVQEAPVDTVGPRVELNSAFPHGVNVGFASQQDGRLQLRVWERGVGETRACGTGAAAAAAAAVKSGKLSSPVTVDLPGGRLQVELLQGHAWITGPARVVYHGVL